MAGKSVEDDLEEVMRLYKEDNRIPCKYGIKCYQKNPAHHEKYKHPPDKRKRHDEISKDTKRAKVNETNNENSVEKEIGEDPSSRDIGMKLPEDTKEAIKTAFLVDMPEDFYSFWSFCESLKKDDPAGALKEVGLQLVGPFDFMNNKDKFINCKSADFLRHWRYYFDPPEFQTVIQGDDKLKFHMGYYRDDPSDNPCFVATNCAAVDCTITPTGDNLFAAVNCYLEKRKSKMDPFHKMKISSVQKALQSWAKENDFDLEENTSAMRVRARKVVAKTFHKAGIVVPVNKTNDTGYRPLIETEANLKRILKNYAESDDEIQRKALMNKLQPIITAANIANDECDFGTSLELGLDLFSFGGEMFHRMIKHLLCTSYSLLDRDIFAEIVKAHLEKREKGSNLSILKENK